MKYLLPLPLVIFALVACSQNDSDKHEVAATQTASAPIVISPASAKQRPRNPWVFRSVLDGQPRMVTVALHDDLSIAFDANHSGLYQAWPGDLTLQGVVYDTRHGPNPVSEGAYYYRHRISEPLWRLERNGQTQAVTPQFRGYRFADDQVVFQYDLPLDDSRWLRVEETPEYREHNGRVGLERRYSVAAADDSIRVGFLLAGKQGDKQFSVETNGTLDERANTLWLNNDAPTQLLLFFASVGGEVAPEVVDTEADAPGRYLIANSDCHACHNELQRTVGPSYREIAEQYQDTPATRDRLAQKIIDGGSGVWGAVPMNPHPELSHEQARQMVDYIFSLQPATDSGPPEIEPVFLGVPSRALAIDAEPKPDTESDELRPGLAAAMSHVEDFTDQIFSRPVLTGVAAKVHTHELDDFGPITINFFLTLDGYIAVQEAGDYTLRLVTDDGGRMNVNGQRVIDRWQFQGPTPSDAVVRLESGLNAIAIEHFQGLAGASISLQWKRPGDDAFSVIPEANLRHRARMVAQPVPYIPRSELVKSIPGDRVPLQDVHPAFELAQARPSWFEPRVGGMDFFDDGRLALCTWDPLGGVYVLEGVLEREPEDITATLVASGLGECLGLKVVDGELYVMQKYELTHLQDSNGDGILDTYRTLSDQWPMSDNFHEFAFGLPYRDGFFYGALGTAVEPGGASTQPQLRERGNVMRIDASDGSVEFIAHGLRTPNGLAWTTEGELFVTDNEGTWLPSSKLVHVREGRFFGFRDVDYQGTKDLPETPPVVWLPQNEIGNSPTEPVALHLGDYAGQMLHGDIYHGGLKRVFYEQVNGEYQGAVFRFSQGLEAGINRLVWAPDGETLLLGGVGNPGNWAPQGKLWHGLQQLRYSGGSAFEMLQVSARSDGLELTFTQPIETGRGISAEEFQVQQWYYQPTAAYGGDKQELQTLAIASVSQSEDRRRVFLELNDLKAGHVLYLRIVEPFQSQGGDSLWSTEAWYTLNRIPAERPGFRRPVQPQPHNTLTEQQRAQGWRLLFDGESTSGWRNFNADSIGAAWQVVDGTLHLDPRQRDGWQTRDGGDIVSEEVFENYELYLEWKLAEGGNSGLMYNVIEGDAYSYAWETGPEYQLLDNPNHPDGVNVSRRSGDLYDLKASRFVAVNPAGQWNRTRLVVRDGVVEHWLNGYKLLSYDQNSPEWQQMIDASKFVEMPDFGRSRSGRLALQDHGDPVWFRNIRIRELVN